MISNIVCFFILLAYANSFVFFNPRIIKPQTFKSLQVKQKNIHNPLRVYFQKPNLDSNFDEEDDDEELLKEVPKIEEVDEENLRLWDLEQDELDKLDESNDEDLFDGEEGKNTPKKRKPLVDFETDKAPNYPCLALMYKFKDEYINADINVLQKEHEEYCMKFDRLVNSEVISMMNSRGVVMLWGGLNEFDKAETKEEINTFMKEEPFLIKGYIDNWDIIDLYPSEDEMESIMKDPLDDNELEELIALSQQFADESDLLDNNKSTDRKIIEGLKEEDDDDFLKEV